MTLIEKDCTTVFYAFPREKTGVKNRCQALNPEGVQKERPAPQLPTCAPLRQAELMMAILDADLEHHTTNL
ncbi:hypothetical protein ACTL6P_02395 [Endozoicomonas acroporae]|uniref:hypothetical protein n=1 Tax=Endozoicomonas acroporae TaxID=1701104 RepID=UPI000C789A1C|nr:hypothetical protein [Endozoicomonas acroporae]